MIYFDTSYLAKCYFAEDGSDAVRDLAANQDKIACCALGRVELIAAFHRKLRENAIERAQFDILFAQIEFDEAQGLWTWLPVTSVVMSKSIDVYRILPADRFLRTADAIHLACAAEHHFAAVYSHDKHLLGAADCFGIQGLDIIS